MKAVIITPSYPPSISGNSTTSSRVVEGLNSKKVKVMVFLPEQLKIKKHLNNLKKFNPNLIHVFHAYKSGLVGKNICEKLNLPLVVTITWTDVNINLFQKEKRAKVIEILKFAQKIIMFHKSIRKKIIKELPNLKNKIKIINQTVKLKHKHCDIRKELKLSMEDFVFFLPAAIRTIKYKMFYLKNFVKLNKKYNIKLILAGSILDEKFANEFFKNIEKCKWIYYIQKIPHDEIKCVFEDVNVSLNTSITEGGMANAVLEALSIGKPVLASAIEGNMSVIKDGYNGLIFKNKKEFYKKAEGLILNEKLRKKLGRNAKNLIKRKFHYRDEINSYVKIYKEIIKRN